MVPTPQGQGDRRRAGRLGVRAGAEPEEVSGETAIEPEEVAAAPEEPEPALDPLPPSDRPHLDPVPVPSVDKDRAEEGERGGRFRRALSKTREYLNRDVSEAFGAGPVPEAFESLEEILVRADVGVTAAPALSDELRERGRELTAEKLGPALQESMRT
jgi:signal recognition particle GTPase